MRKVNKRVPVEKQARMLRRKLSIRKKIIGTVERPRVVVSKGNKNIYVQVIDDTNSLTLASCQTFGKNKVGSGANVASGKDLGVSLAEKLKKINVTTVVYDRNGLQYCGVIASIAESLRENGINL
jgi:large subunit ribosomal protein L18